MAAALWFLVPWLTEYIWAYPYDAAGIKVATALQLLIAGLVGGGIYLGVARLFHAEELGAALRLVRRRAANPPVSRIAQHVSPRMNSACRARIGADAQPATGPCAFPRELGARSAPWLRGATPMMAAATPVTFAPALAAAGPYTARRGPQSSRVSALPLCRARSNSRRFPLFQ